LVPTRALGSVREETLTGSGCFDDLLLALFCRRERVTVLRLEFVLVIGPSRGLRDGLPPHHLNPTQASDLAGRGPKKRASGGFQWVQQCSVCEAMPVHSEQDDCFLALWLPRFFVGVRKQNRDYLASGRGNPASWIYSTEI